MLTSAPVRKAADEQLVKLGDEMALVSPTGLLAGCASVDIIRQRVRIVNFPERLGDSGGIDTCRAGLLVRIGDVERQRLDVAVKNDPDE